jgi:hypothetical protein
MIDLNCQEFLDQLKNSEFVKEHPFSECQKVFLQAYDLLQFDSLKKDEWFLTSNSYYFNKSPLEVILLGEGEAVIDLLKSRGM